MVQRNLGLSFLPQYVVENSIYRDQLQVLDVKDFRMHMYRQLFYHKDKWLTQAMKLFLSMAGGPEGGGNRREIFREFAGKNALTLAPDGGV